MNNCICGELETIKHYGHHPKCVIHSKPARDEYRIKELEAENESLKKIIESLKLALKEAVKENE